MNRSFRHLLLVVLAIFAGACARHKIIPDDELAQIFHDAFLANAYVGNRNLMMDSMNVYEPIFARYGYTTSDVQYTIGNFSKRKSARLGNVVEQAIQMLENEGAYYTREVAILDTIDRVAARTLTRKIVTDSLVRVRALRDTSRVNRVLDVEPGEYNIRLKYLIDSLDRNDEGIRAQMWLERRDSTRANYYNVLLRRNSEESLTRTFRTDSTHRRLHLRLVTLPGKPRPLSVTFRDVTVEHTPPVPEAVKSFYEQQLDIRIFADEFFRAANPKDSL